MRRFSSSAGESFHIFTKSIEKFQIFNHPLDYARMINLLRYYQIKGIRVRYSHYIRSREVRAQGFDECFENFRKGKKKRVEILAYCIMPTHVHFVLKQLEEGGISWFMANVLNGYTRYFNRKYKRLGPLWVGRFKGVFIKSQHQLYVLTRYVHLNPCKSKIVKRPEDWPYSSYHEYIGRKENDPVICPHEDYIDLSAAQYKKFIQKGSEYLFELYGG